MEVFEIYGVLAIPFVTAMVQMLTTVGLPKRLAPLVSLALGVALGLAGFADGNILRGIITGMAIGLSASGFYSAVRVPFKNDKE